MYDDSQSNDNMRRDTVILTLRLRIYKREGSEALQRASGVEISKNLEECIHDLHPQNAYCSLRPSADGERAKRPIIPGRKERDDRVNPG